MLFFRQKFARAWRGNPRRPIARGGPSAPFGFAHPKIWGIMEGYTNEFFRGCGTSPRAEADASAFVFVPPLRAIKMINGSGLRGVLWLRIYWVYGIGMGVMRYVV